MEKDGYILIASYEPILRHSNNWEEHPLWDQTGYFLNVR
jgi:hypothetical protein